MHVIPNPIECGFFGNFLPLLTDETRAAVADGMGSYLRDIGAEESQQLWDTWLKNYVNLRLLGIPVSLSTAETRHMLEWCLYLGQAFPEAVELITRMPMAKVNAYMIVQILLENPALENFPKDACRLAIAALIAEDHPYLGDLPNLYGRLHAVLSNAPELISLKELMFQRGWREE